MISKQPLVDSLQKFCNEKKGVYPFGANDCVSGVKHNCCMKRLNENINTEEQVLRFNSTCSRFNFPIIPNMLLGNCASLERTHHEYCTTHKSVHPLKHNSVVEFFCYMKESVNNHPTPHENVKNKECIRKGIYTKQCIVKEALWNEKTINFVCTLKANANPLIDSFDCSKFNETTIHQWIRPSNTVFPKYHVNHLHYPSHPKSNLSIPAHRIGISVTVFLLGIFLLFVLFKYQPGKYLSSIFTYRIKKYNKKLSYIFKTASRKNEFVQYEGDRVMLNPQELFDDEVDEEISNPMETNESKKPKYKHITRI